jgi:2-aminobenzoate-CoA ligase
MSATQTAHVDTFAADHMPALEDQPDFIFSLPELQFPAQLNCAHELLDQRIAMGEGGAKLFNRSRRQCVDVSRFTAQIQSNRPGLGAGYAAQNRQPRAASGG